jgi:hypothetical protein
MCYVCVFVVMVVRCVMVMYCALSVVRMFPEVYMNSCSVSVVLFMRIVVLCLSTDNKVLHRKDSRCEICCCNEPLSPL